MNNINFNSEKNMKEEDFMTGNLTKNNNMEVSAMINNLTENNNMEVSAMTNKNTFNFAAVNSDSSLPADLSTLIPSEEAAQEITVSPVNKMDLTQLIPDDEREIAAEETLRDMGKIRNLGFFSPTKHMMRINNALGGMFSARLYEDEKGQRYVEYIQQYHDGSFSPVMRVPQSCILMAVRYKFVLENIEESRFRNMMKKYISEAMNDYYGKFRGSSEDDMDIKDILNTFCMVIEDLPVISDMKVEMTAEEFYWNVVNNVHQLMAAVTFDNYKAYYPLDEENIGELASMMGMKKLELLKKLKHLGFLYLTPSSKGYQTNVRIKHPNGSTDTQWMYCIYKFSYFAGIKEDAPKGVDLNNI